MNAVPHVVEVMRLRKGPYYFMTPWLVLYAGVAFNAWVASTMFHSKKTPFNIQYDYISALGLLTMAGYLVSRRMLGQSSSWTISLVLFALMFGGFMYRALDMINNRVSFDSHMKLCIGIVIVSTAMWIMWVGMLSYNKVSKSKDPTPTTRSTSGSNPAEADLFRHRWLCLFCQVWLVLASALEGFDFPAYLGVFDAHSLW